MRISRIVSRPSISGIMMSMSTMSMSGFVLQDADGVAAVVGGHDHHVVFFQHGRQGEDVAHVVVDDQHLLAGQQLVGIVQVEQQLPLVLPGRLATSRCRKKVVMIEQPFGRMDAAHACRPGRAASRRGSSSSTSLAVAVDDDRRAGRRSLRRAMPVGHHVLGQVAGIRAHAPCNRCAAPAAVCRRVAGRRRP